MLSSQNGISARVVKKTYDKFAISTHNSVWLHNVATSFLDKTDEVPKSEMMLPTIYNGYCKVYIKNNKIHESQFNLLFDSGYHT
jgi:hypothetical protein